MIFKRRTQLEKVIFRKQTVPYHGVTTISRLKPSYRIPSNGVIRYDYFELAYIVETKLAVRVRDFRDLFVSRENPYYDFWAHFQYYMFWSDVRNGQGNRMYIGIDKKMITTRLGREPSPEEMYMQLRFWRTFKHLTKRGGYINVYLGW